MPDPDPRTEKTTRPGTKTWRVYFPDAPFHELDVEAEAFGDGYAIEHTQETVPDRAPAELVAACDAIILYHLMPLPASLLKAARNCKIVVRGGVGFDSVDLAAAGQLGIPVCNVPDYGTTDVADHAIGLMMDLRRGSPYLAAQLRADPVANWNFADAPATQRRLRGQRFAVIGLGRIGLAAARRAGGFDMEIGFYDPYLPVGGELAAGYQRFRDLRDILGWADIVSIHTPLTDETRGMFDEVAFGSMKPGAILINTARGPIVDIDALFAALKDGSLGGAGLDVLPVEPPRPDHPLIAAYSQGADWLKGRLYLTPHAAFACPESLHDLRRLTAVTVRDYAERGSLRACVNGAELGDRRRA